MPPETSHNIDDYNSFLLALQDTLGVVVPDEQRHNLIERIKPLLTVYKCDSLTALADSLKIGKSENIRSVVLDVVSQTQLSWHMSAEIRDVLNNYIFAQLPENARVWIVGCGQGQFAYAVGMELADYEYKNDKVKNAQFIATDLSTIDIKVAESGIYNKQQMMGLSEERKKLFMTTSDDANEAQVKQKIRQQFNFSKCDLTGDFQSLGQMDLIICPQTLVYFSNGAKAAIVQQCSDLLKSGGILLTGNNQVLLPILDDLERVDHSTGVFYRQRN